MAKNALFSVASRAITAQIGSGRKKKPDGNFGNLVLLSLSVAVYFQRRSRSRTHQILCVGLATSRCLCVALKSSGLVREKSRLIRAREKMLWEWYYVVMRLLYCAWQTHNTV